MWKKFRAIYGLLSPIFLAMGLLTYFLFRDWGGLILFAWIPVPESAGNAVIQLVPSAFSHVPQYNLAGMLWFVSGILFFRFVWFHRPREQMVYVWCFYIVGVLLELSQLSPRVPGTFDVWDLFFMGLGAFVEGLLHRLFVVRRIA